MPTGTPRRHCKGCNRHRDDCGGFSATGLCMDCGEARRQANARQLVAHAGPYFEHWRARSLAALGAPQLDAGSEAA